MSVCATPENVLNPEGLHVYSFYNSSRNITPAGVALPVVVVHRYKHSMPLASAKNGPYDTFKNVPVTGFILLGNFNVWRKMKYLSACATPENVLNPEGLHVYSFYISSRITTPAGVALPVVVVHCYKYSMPLASAKNGPYDTFKNVPVTGITLLGNFNVWREKKYLSACATPENVLNPEGLHVYSFYNNSRNTTPAGVALPMVGVHCYKQSMMLASAKQIKARDSKLEARSLQLRNLKTKSLQRGYFAA